MSKKRLQRRGRIVCASKLTDGELAGAMLGDYHFTGWLSPWDVAGSFGVESDHASRVYRQIIVPLQKSEPDGGGLPRSFDSIESVKVKRLGLWK